MSGALLQLTATGAADTFLTGTPTVTAFRNVWKRHTAFATENVLQAWSGEIGWGRQAVSVISRQGDILLDTWLVVTLPDISTYAVGGKQFKYANSAGYSLFEHADVLIGGSRVQRIESTFLAAWDELVTPAEKRAGLDAMIGRYSDHDVSDASKSFDAARTLYIPLRFFFCEETQLGLSMLGLAFHDVRISVQFRAFRECVKSYTPAAPVQDSPGPPPEFSAQLWGNYAYLDSAERARHTSTPMECLLTLTQSLTFPIDNSPARKLDLSAFSHPVRELIFVYQTYSATSGGPDSPADRFSFAPLDPDPATVTASDLRGDFFLSARLSANGHDREAERDAAWHRLCVPYKHHTCCPTRGVYVYSFCLDPEDNLAPSGSFNFSRMDSVVLFLKLAPKIAASGTVTVFARSHNILKVANGFASLVFAS